jgi:hypothetical protein
MPQRPHGCKRTGAGPGGPGTRLTARSAEPKIAPMSKEKQCASGEAPGRPTVTDKAAAERRAREARLAEALRANLRRRKADLAGRGPGTDEDRGA